MPKVNFRLCLTPLYRLVLLARLKDLGITSRRFDLWELGTKGSGYENKTKNAAPVKHARCVDFNLNLVNGAAFYLNPASHYLNPRLS